MKLQADRILSVRTDRTVYLCGDNAVKVFPKGEKVGEVFAEAANLAAAADGGVFVPELIAVRKQNQHWTVETAYVEGKPLNQLIAESPASEERYLDDMAQLLKRIHGSGVSFAGHLSDRIAEDIRAAGINPNATTRLLSYLSSLPKGDCPCHCDFMPENLIRTEKGQLCILDWENAAMGNPLADAAFTYLRFVAGAQSKTAERWLKCFCAANRCLTERVSEWFPVCAAALCRACLAPCRSGEYKLLSEYFSGL